MSTQSLLHSLFQYKAWANANLFAALARIEATAPQPERHAALRVLNHIYVVDRIFAAHLGGTRHGYGASNTPETPTVQALQAAMADSDRWYLEFVAQLAPQGLQETVSFAFTDGAAGSMTREQMLAHVATHGDYHRGAVGRILPELAVRPYTVFLHQAPARQHARA